MITDFSTLQYFQTIHSEVGLWAIGANDGGVTLVELCEMPKIPEQPNAHTQECIRQLGLYFKGKLQEFNLPLSFMGYTDFSVKVWHELLNIPYGTTISYKELAIKLGDAKVIRAAASANGRNPIPIIVPCHRVIGSDGSMTGYSMGLHVKKFLLALENPTKYGDHQMELSF